MQKMETIMIFQLFLLICSFSTALLQSDSQNEIISHLKQTESQTEGTGTLSDPQQRCTQDINAVLREMSASLGGLKVGMEYLQMDNEAKTKEIELLKEQDQVQAAKVRKLEQQYQAQAEELISVKARANNTEDQVEVLSKEGKEKRVAFSASLLASGGGHIGPFNTQRPLVFRNVVANIGNAYNPDTVFFIAPVRGAYHFEFYLHGGGHASHTTGAVLVKNGKPFFTASAHQPSYSVSPSNGVTLLLEIGDVVLVNQVQNSRIYDDHTHPTTISGHLLFTM
ncbi:uncharacterized protein LOC119773268 [Cyprinodon tularosa]|uniref:uncharacterized protein LOC119773268 n=1 Tax=Cyprinodon tularosa TaxID=77115 RepID=UPI0018E2555C|nr:uncharacterized protein LOC119773268 [Cyprinodon tularosa]